MPIQWVKKNTDLRASKLGKDREEIRTEVREELNKMHQEEKQMLIEEKDQEHRNTVEVEVQSRISNLLREKVEEHQEEMRKKDEQVEEAKLQVDAYLDEKIKEVLKNSDEKHRQKETEFHLQISRAQQENEDLADQVGKLQKTLDNIPPELKGTAGEIILFDDLHEAFPEDDLVEKIVGEEMPDIIQTIVTENGERIATPILWDMKTGDSIGTKDIEKAKRYKEKYNTDSCILVSSKPIGVKDTKNGREGVIGKRDGITLVHKPIAVGVAEETRNFLIKESRLTKNNNGRASKQERLYDYITSPARFRKMQERITNRLKLEELIRKQEEYNKKAWKEQKKIIKKSFDFDKDDQEKIKDITQQDQIGEEGKG